jgi:patatin-like phospholipase/acyl hydrolase
MSCKVLALSGGGYRGLYTVRVLRRLEDRIGKPLSEHFDLISGTSIGGIVALGIAAGIPLKTIEEIFISKGKSIFPSPLKQSEKNIFLKPFNRIRNAARYLRAIFMPIHSADGLRSVLDELFGDLTMGDLQHVKILVTAANLSTGTPKIFKTPHHKDIYLDAKLKLVDVALATSAAPVYFPIHEVYDQSTFYADGGLIGNAPGLFGWLEAKTRLNTPEEDIYVLSIGTLAGKPSISGNINTSKGARFWISPEKPRLLTFLMSQQEHLSNYMLSLLLKDRYYLIDGSVSDEAVDDIDLDDASPAATRTLIGHAEKHFADFTSTIYCQTHFPRKETL